MMLLEDLKSRVRRLAEQSAGVLPHMKRVLAGRRPAATILCVVNNQVYRLDLDASGERSGELEKLSASCDTLTDLPGAISSAIAGERPGGRRLWLLHEGLPNHTVSISANQVTGLEGMALNQALLLEMEQLTGATHSHQQASHTLFSQEDGQNQYWLVHVPKTLVAQILRAARQQGCQFAGLSHPGSLPLPLAPEATGKRWARLEIWSDVLIGINSTAQGGNKMWVIQAGTKPRRIQGEVERWRDSLGEGVSWERIGEGTVLDYLPPNTHSIDMWDEATLGHWLGLWGKFLVQGLQTRVPVIEPPEDQTREYKIMAGGAVAALAICLLHWGWHSRHIESLEKDRTYFKSNQGRMMSAEMEVEKLRKQRDSIKKQQAPNLPARAAQMPDVLTALRLRYASLLREVSANATDGMVIEEIKTKPNGVIVKGVSLDASEANGLASALEGRLRGLGWRVEPARKKDLAYDAVGGPWEFEILLTDSGLPGFSVPQLSVQQQEGKPK